jgi:ICE2
MLWYLIRNSASALSLFLVILTIPLAFDVGGRECGLAFSLSLSIFYFLLSSFRLITPAESRFRAALAGLVGVSGWAVVVGLLIWSLNKFSIDAGSPYAGWVERTFGGKRAKDDSIMEWIFGRRGLLETTAIGGWDSLLRWSTPVFQIGEGFCSLLVIQACGQITKWLVNRERGDSWMVSLVLVLSSTDICRLVYWVSPLASFPPPSTFSGESRHSQKLATWMPY